MTEIGQVGIENYAVFNLIAGQVYLDQYTVSGIRNHTTGTFSNAITIYLGQNATASGIAIHNEGGIFNNNTGAQIRALKFSLHGINNSGNFYNQGSIFMPVAAVPGSTGIRNSGFFHNSTGEIQIDGTTGMGIFNASGTFTNQSYINIGSIAHVGNFGLYNNPTAIFNNTGGQLTIDRVNDTGIYNYNGIIHNQALLNIGSIGSIGADGIANRAGGNIINHAGGQININRFALAGINHSGERIVNNGIINIGTISGGLDGIFTLSVFENNPGASVRISNCPQYGIFLANNYFQNFGTVSIGQAETLSSMITAVAPVAGYFHNYTGGVVKGSGIINPTFFYQFGGKLAPGFSPGKMIFAGDETFYDASIAIEINGTGMAGVNYDQIQLDGVGAVLGGRLELSINYTPAQGDEFVIIDCEDVTGTFATVTGLLPNWQLRYNYPVLGKLTLAYPAPLPVELTEFSVRAVESEVQLDWTTASEHLHAGFFVERSPDGLHWSDLGFVAGKGESSNMQHYHFTDKAPLPGLSYYRLRQVDTDGNTDFSPLRSVTMPDAEKGFTVFPNPVENNVLHIRLEGKTEESSILVHLFNAAGQLVRTAVLPESPDMVMDLRDVPPGAYLLEAQGEGRSFQKKVVVQ